MKLPVFVPIARDISYQLQQVSRQKPGKLMNLPLQFLVVAALCLGGFGCAGMVAIPVADADRDQSGKYDGRWRGRVSGGAAIQYVGSQGLRCSSQNRDISLQVENGVLRALSGPMAGTMVANVNTEGKFRLEVPTSLEYSGGGFLVQKPGITLVVLGKLSEDARKGLYVIGMNQLNKEGCSHRIAFTRIGTQQYANKHYSNKYKGLFAGITSRLTVVARFGEPIEEKRPGRFTFKGDFDVTFNPVTRRINTIIIYNTDYTDTHGFSIGTPQKQLSKIKSIDIKGDYAIDTKHGIVYWLDEQSKIKEIVLASDLLTN